MGRLLDLAARAIQPRVKPERVERSQGSSRQPHERFSGSDWQRGAKKAREAKKACFDDLLGSLEAANDEIERLYAAAGCPPIGDGWEEHEAAIDAAALDGDEAALRDALDRRHRFAVDRFKPPSPRS